MKNSESGFTLIELMVAMAMASIVVGVIYSAHRTQTKIYTEQDKVAEMQQNIRSGLMFLQREARMAGYNPKDANDKSCNANPTAGPSVAPGIHTATATRFGFSMDLNGDGDCADSNENVTYSLYTANGVQNLGRAAPGNQPVAENITHINFVYMFPPPLVGTAVVKSPTSTPLAVDFKNIIAVQVSLIARAKAPDQKTHTTSFSLPVLNAWGNADGGTVWKSFTDSYSRRLLTITINCRNMGLE
jgi:type IV pilus assembly protein PilW